MKKSRKSRILIIDDNQDIHDDIKKILLPASNTSALDSLVQDISGCTELRNDSFDVQIDSALLGEDGLAMVRQARLDGNPYALVFVDIRMPPGLDGIHTIKLLQQEDEHLQYVIITAYSDYSWEDVTTEITPKDNLLILKKPFESIEIRQSASALLEKWHLVQERAEALLKLLHSKKLETIGVMASGIAHDFNNLLMAIIGNIELAVMTLPEEHQALQFLSASSDVVKSAKELTQKFLIFSNIESPNTQVTSTRDLITDAANHVFSGSDVTCEFVLPEKIWLADVDPYQVGHILCEIFKNAKEAQSGKGTVTVTAENITSFGTDHADTSQEKKQIRISISDQGCGIEEKDLANIYDPYYSTKTRGVRRGMGFGLAMVAAVISQHGGTVHTESTPGVGTTVEITLPASEKQLPEE